MCVPMPPDFLDLPERQMMLPFIGRLPVNSQMRAINYSFVKEPQENISESARDKFFFRKILRAFAARRTYLLRSIYMATLKPFAALRPKPELAAQICELPYDVMSSDEAREMAAGNPLSFLHVSKPEIDLPPGTDIYSPEVYAKGKENFQKLISQGALKQDEQPNFYLYRQIMGNHAQVGLVAAASCEEYLANIIKKHEFTRPDKEDDRVRHIETLNSQTGPVFLTYRAVAAFDEFVAKKISETPAVDFTGKDGVRHTSWTISERGRNLVRRSAVRADSVSLHRRRPSSQRGGGAGFSIAQRRGPKRAISRRDFSAQPDADPALQPRAERFERPHAGRVAEKTGRSFPHHPHGPAHARAQTRTGTFYEPPLAHADVQAPIDHQSTTRLNSST